MVEKFTAPAAMPFAPDDDPVAPPEDGDDEPLPCEVCGTETDPDALVWVQAETPSAEAPICQDCDARFAPVTLADCGVE